METNKQTTALQDLIAWCISSSFNTEGQDGVKYIAIDYEEMIQTFDKLLTKEKEQIRIAYGEGVKDAEKNKIQWSLNYYNETYQP